MPDPSPFKSVPMQTNPYQSIYGPTPQVSGFMIAKTQDGINQIDMDLRALTMNMENDVKTQYSIGSPNIPQWTYIYNVASELSRVIQAIKSINVSNYGGYSEQAPIMTYPTPSQMIYGNGQNDGYMPQFAQYGYVMSQSQSNVAAPIQSDLSSNQIQM